MKTLGTFIRWTLLISSGPGALFLNCLMVLTTSWYLIGEIVGELSYLFVLFVSLVRK